MIAPMAPPGSRLMDTVDRLRILGSAALKRMYKPTEGLFAFRLRRAQGRDLLEGVSHRYTAIVLIALAEESEETVRSILGAHDPMEICARLILAAEGANDLGAVALTTWAARAWGHPAAARAMARLAAMRPDTACHPTVEMAWSLSALVGEQQGPTDLALAECVAQRLMRSFRPAADLFPHWPAGAATGRLRDHVCCYADLVYPIQALSFYYRATGSSEAHDLARRCARKMCALQGPQGQWWWHYDIRTGRMLEKFPVYAIHQDAMGPMALLDHRECCGVDHWPSVERSMTWLWNHPEMPNSLVDEKAGVIWRKVARHEPGKLVRNLQAGLSKVHRRLRLLGVDWLFPVGYVDYESRPYHMGWMLYAWNPRRLQRLRGG